MSTVMPALFPPWMEKKKQNYDSEIGRINFIGDRDRGRQQGAQEA